MVLLIHAVVVWGNNGKVTAFVALLSIENIKDCTENKKPGLETRPGFDYK